MDCIYLKHKPRKNRGKSLKNRSKNKNYLITQGGVYTTAVQVPSLLKYIKYEHPNLLNYSINKSYITDNDKDSNLLCYVEVLKMNPKLSDHQLRQEVRKVTFLGNMLHPCT